MITQGTISAATLAAMYQSLNALFMQGLGIGEIYWDKLATLSPSTTGQEDYAWLGAFPALREWLGDRVIQNLALHGYSIKNKDYEATIGISRNDVLDNKMGMYRTPLIQLGQNARLHPDSLIFTLLAAGFATVCYDGQYFIDDDHPVGSSTASNDGGGSGTAWYLMYTKGFIKPLIYQHRQSPQLVALDQATDENVFMRKQFQYGVDYRSNVGYGLWQMAYGSKQTLDADAYAAGRAAMAAFTNDKGIPLGFIPNLLVVPPSLETAGREILLAQRNGAGATNVWQGTAELMMVPYLS